MRIANEAGIVYCSSRVQKELFFCVRTTGSVKNLNLVAVLPPLPRPNHELHEQEHLTPHMPQTAPPPSPKEITELPLTRDRHLILPSRFSAFCFAGVAFFPQHWGAFGFLAIRHCLFPLSTFSRVHRDLGGHPKLHVWLLFISLVLILLVER